MIDISLIPKTEESKPISVNKIFFWVSLIVLIASIIAGVVIVFMLTSSKNNLISLNKQLQELDDNVNSQQETIQFAQSILVANQIISSHIYPSKLIDFLEKNTNVFIQWANLSVDLSSQTVSLSGRAHDLLAIAQQIKKFEDSKSAYNIKLEGVASENNGVSFRLSFSLQGGLLVASY